MADFQAAAREIAERFDGHLAHNQGDQLVVYFGYPEPTTTTPARVAA